MWVVLVVKISFLILLLIMAAADIKEKSVPVAGLIVMAVLACGGAVVRFLDDGFTLRSILTILLGLVPGAVLIFLSVATRKVGIGDSIILGLMGLLESYISILIVLCIGSVIMAVFSIVLLIAKRVGRNTRLPFVPFIAVGYIVNLGLLFL